MNWLNRLRFFLRFWPYELKSLRSKLSDSFDKRINKFRFWLRLLPFYLEALPSTILIWLKRTANNYRRDFKFRLFIWRWRWHRFFFYLKLKARSMKWSAIDLSEKIKDLPLKMKRRVWNKHLKVWYLKDKIPENEFDPSLNLDLDAMIEMSADEREAYEWEIIRRRNLAHEQDLARQDAA